VAASGPHFFKGYKTFIEMQRLFVKGGTKNVFNRGNCFRHESHIEEGELKTHISTTHARPLVFWNQPFQIQLHRSGISQTGELKPCTPCLLESTITLAGNVPFPLCFLFSILQLNYFAHSIHVFNLWQLQVRKSIYTMIFHSPFSPNCL